MASAAKQGRPFYQVVTKVATPGTEGRTVDLPLVTLPPGTVLFRALKLPDINPVAFNRSNQISLREKAVLNFYRDFLGEPLPDGTVCLLPTHNTFFYPFPYVGFGLHDIGSKFTMMVAYVLVHPVTVVCAISPSDFVRGMGQRYGEGDPWARCNAFPYRCRFLSFTEEEALSYDNCLNPNYQISSGTRGWMALADLDSFEPRKLKKRGVAGKDAPMSSYIRELNARHPGIGKELTTWAYKDDHQHAGFPEIAMFPYYNHPGPAPLTRVCQNERQAQRLIQTEIRKNNLNYLPLAIFTRNGTVDMTNGFYDVGRLNLEDPALVGISSRIHQEGIENQMNAWMNNAITNGLNLPFYKEGKLSLDSRTGFLILPQMVPSNLKIPLPPAVRAEEKAAAAAAAAASKGAAAGGAPAPPKLHDSVPYKFLCLPMDTPQTRQRAYQYLLLFRSYLPDKFMRKYEKDKTGLRRAMIFNRPGVLGDVFKTIGIEMPKEYGKTLYEAGKLYQAETGIKPTGKKATASGATGAGPAEKKVADVLHVTAIPAGSTVDEIRSVFERYGVESVTIDLPAAAFVRLTSPTAAAVAKATDRKVVIQGGIVNVAVATDVAVRAFYTSVRGMAAAGLTATAGSTTPPFNYGAQSPMYGSTTPVYNATGEGVGVEGAGGAAAGGAGGEGAYSPHTPEFGGAAAAAAPAPAASSAGSEGLGPRTPEFRRQMGGGATRKGRKSQKARPKQTRKHQDMAKRLGKVFADMWKEHAKTTKRG